MSRRIASTLFLALSLSLPALGSQPAPTSLALSPTPETALVAHDAVLHLAPQDLGADPDIPNLAPAASKPATVPWWTLILVGLGGWALGMLSCVLCTAILATSYY